MVLDPSQPSSPDSTVAFGSFPPSPAPQTEQHRLEVEKLLAVIARGRAQETRHVCQLKTQATELSQLRPQLQHYNALCSQHEQLLGQFQGLRNDHEWLSQEHLQVFSESQQQQGRLRTLEQEAQHARQELADQEAHGAKLQSQLGTAEMACVELRIEKAAVQTLQNQLFAKQQADLEQQQRLRSLEADCASLRVTNGEQQQQLEQCQCREQEFQQQLRASQEKLKTSEEYGSSVLAILEEVRAVTQGLLQANGKVLIDEPSVSNLKHVLREASSAAQMSTAHHRRKKQVSRHSKPSAADRKPS